jgi:hypothetical protein
MAKIGLNSALTRITGTIDNWVYRNTGEGMVVAKRPLNMKPPTAAQLAVRQLFADAATYAKAAIADSVVGPRYAAAAAAVGQRPFPFAVADFLNEPVVEAIDSALYHGAIGNVIKVRALDDFEVAGVTVAIRDAANAVLEQGAAIFADGLWHYTATTAIAAGTAVTIEAVATDRPGHSGSRQVPLVVA